MAVIETLLAWLFIIGCVLTACYLFYLFITALRRHYARDYSGLDLSTAGFFPFFSAAILLMAYYIGLEALGLDQHSLTTLYETEITKEELNYSQPWQTEVTIEHPGKPLKVSVRPLLKPFRNAQAPVKYRLVLLNQNRQLLFDGVRYHPTFKNEIINRSGSNTYRTEWLDIKEENIKAPKSGKLLVQIFTSGKAITNLALRIEDPLKTDGKRGL